MSKVISADVSDELAERVEEEREEGESRSAAVRRLVRAGIESEGNSWKDIPTRRMVGGIGILLILVATAPPQPLDLAVGVFGMALTAIGALLELSSLTTARP